MEKNCSNQRCFKKNITKLNFQPAQYKKNKFDNDNSEEKNTKKMKKRRRQFWKKNGKKTYGQLNIKKIKSTNIILKKIITTKTKGKKNHAGKHCSNL